MTGLQAGSGPTAFRFGGAGFSVPHPAGLSTTPTGSLAMVTGDDAIRQALMMLLSTTPGERVMRPEYGSHLHRLAFAPNDLTTAGLAIHYVRQALRRWEPRVEIVHLDAAPDPEDGARLLISLTYRVRASLGTHALVYPLDLDGGDIGDVPGA